MENLKGLLRVLDERVSDGESRLEKEYLRLGESLIALSRESVSGTALHEIYEQARGLNESIAKNLARQERLAKLVQQLDDLDERISQKNKEIAVLRAEVEPYFEDVGRRIVERSRESMEGLTPFAGRVEQLRALEAGLQENDRELARTTAAQKSGFFRQALSEGKRVYLHGVVRARSMRADALYRQLGKDICERDNLEELDSKALADVMEPLLKYREARHQAEAQLAALANKRSRLQTDIETLTEGEQPRRSLGRLEAERAATERRLVGVLAEMGHRFLEGSLAESITGKSLKAPVAAIQELGGELSELKARRERVDAAIKIDTLDAEVAKSRTRIQSLEATVRKANLEIEALTGKIEAMGRERERLLAVRGEEIGSAEDLLK